MLPDPDVIEEAARHLQDIAHSRIMFPKEMRSPKAQPSAKETIHRHNRVERILERIGLVDRRRRVSQMRYKARR